MSESIIAIVNRIHDKYLHDIPSKDATRGDRFKASMRKLLQFLLMRKKLVLLALLLLTICFFVLLFLMEDYLTKRQAYPIRHVLFQCNETVQFSRGKIGRQDRFWDRDARTIIQKGNSDGTKLGDILGIQKLETTDEGGQYQLEDKDKTRIAYAVTKLEPVQAGISFTGTLDFRETYAEILGENDRFINYRIIPERGAHNLEVNVIADAEGNKKLVNKLITYRSKPLGVLWGTRFRSATSLDEFLDTPKNQSKERHFFELVDQYHGQAKLSGEQRLKLVQELAQTINSMETQSIYISHEDGIVDYVAQESSTFLFNRPSVVQQFTTPLYSDDGTKPSPGNSGKQGDFAINNTNQELVHIRVERLIDLFPGNYFLLNNLIIGDAPNIVRPFSHTNNGGYEIVDGQGVVAKIEIEDFFLHYGDDLLYKYYLDKDGNGIIDSDKELIGQVLYRIHNDDRVSKPEENADGKSEAITQRYSYSFMAGNNWDNRQEDFYLCNTIESFIVNEINRGFGTFSDLGWINSQRSNIRLLENRDISNLARAMSAESALVAKYDIVALLKAAKRTYIEKFVQTPKQPAPPSSAKP